MNETKVPGIWKWSVLLLIICNIGLLLTIWLRPELQRTGGDHPHHPERPREYVIRELRFSAPQVERYDELIHAHRAAMDSLREASMELRKVLFNNIKNDAAGINADSVAQLIADKQRAIEMVTYDHFRQVRAICTDDQKTSFDKIIVDVIRRMNGGMRGGSPPHGRDEEGPPPPGDR